MTFLLSLLWCFYCVLIPTHFITTNLSPFHQCDYDNRLIATTATIEVGEVMTTSTTYDKAGNRLTLRDGEGVVTCYGYDLMDRLTSVTENCLSGQSPTHEVNVRSEYGYDYIGNRVVFTNARNYTTTYEYDTLNRLITETDALDHITLYEYDAVGNRTVMTDAEGQITEFAYDGVYRVEGIDYSNSTIATADVAFDYDALGNRLVMTDGTGVTTYGYDRANRLIVTTNGAEQSVEYTYDVMGNRLGLSNALYNLAYYYDHLNRLQTVEVGGTDQFNYSYDDAGRLTMLTYPNGVVSSYDYDEAGRLIALSHSANSTPIADYEYTFDKANNRTVISETIPTYVAPTRAITYTYDPLYRLTGAEYATGEFYTYTYDATGNRESFLFDDGVVATTEYTYNAVNWLIEVDNVDYLYDLNGNLREDSANEYFYDGANRLTQVTDGVNETFYSYDGVGNRVAQTVNAQITEYTLDVAGGLPEVLVAGETSYVQVGGQLLAQSDGTGNWQYIQPDHLGSVRHLTDGAGQVDAYGEYDPFGVPVPSYDTESAFGYTGEQADESGLLFLRARYYDAETGRFLSQDTWKGENTQPQTQHLYNYVIGNPVNYVDPTGHYIDLGVGSNAPRNMHDFSTGQHVSYNDNYTWKENDPRCQSNQYCEVEAGASLFVAAVAPGAAQYLLLEGGAVATSQWVMAHGTVYGNALLAQFPWMAQAGAGLLWTANTVDDAATLYAGATGDYNAVAQISAMSNADGYIPLGDAIAGVQYFGNKLARGISSSITDCADNISNWLARGSSSMPGNPAFSYVDELLLPYQPDGFLTGQRRDYMCIAGSCQMIMNAPQVDQYELSAALSLNEGGGYLRDVPQVLSQYNWSTSFRSNMSLTSLQQALNNGSVIVTVKTSVTGLADSASAHAIVVDYIRNGYVAVRDPLPVREGEAHLVPLGEFMDGWNRAGNSAVVREP